jgi:hypothetical protein
MDDPLGKAFERRRELSGYVVVRRRLVVGCGNAPSQLAGNDPECAGLGMGKTQTTGIRIIENPLTDFRRPA